MTFDPTVYGPSIAAILGEGQRPMPLGPGKPIEEKRRILAGFDSDRDIPNVQNREAAKACHAGLWLYWDFHDESHAISQDLQTAEGSAWHAILHRREPDAGNSNYWWKRVGNHPLFGQLKTQSPAYGYEYSTAAKFIEFCERVRGTGTTEEENAQHVQRLEWQNLFEYCFRLSIVS